MESSSTPNEVKAIIAAGGLKSRLIHPVNVSKAFFPFLNKPAIHYTLGALSEIGLDEAFLAVGNNEAQNVTLPERFNGLTVRTLVEDYPRGTAGCLKSLEELFNGHTLVLITGSVLYFSKEDLDEMIRYHRKSGATLTIGITSAANGGSDNERVLVGDNGQIEHISRIYPSMSPGTKLETSGIYILESHALKYVETNGFFDMKEQLAPLLSEKDEKVVGWTHQGYSSYARNIGEYLRENLEFLKNHKVARKHLEGYTEIDKQIWVGSDVQISPDATLVRPLVIGPKTHIKEKATVVGPSIIGSECVIGRNSFIRESVFWDKSAAPPNLEVDRCLISGEAFSTENSHCRERVILKGVPSFNGIGKAMTRPTIHPVAQKPGRRWLLANERVYLGVKRVLDIFLGAIFFLLSLPIMAVIVAAIRLDSKGSIFFRQTRCGHRGKQFKMIKFRTMVENAEELKPSIVHLNQADGPMFKICKDPRETRVGRFLRASKLDELPQMVNVLKGEMSLVGPRPLSMDEMKYNPHWRDARLEVRPGLTGLWQINDSDSLLFHEWIQCDLKYVDERSTWLDFKILAKTFAKVLRAIRNR